MSGKITRQELSIDLKKELITQQPTPPTGTEEGRLWLDTSDNTFQGTALDGINGELAAHKMDNTSHVYYGVASGVNAKTVTLVPAPGSLVEGFAISFKNTTLNTGAVTLNVNGLGAKPVLSSSGEPVEADDLKAGSIYTLRYSGASFILQGEGGDIKGGLNLYTQMTEPKLKEGIWLQTSKNYTSALNDNEIYHGGQWVSSELGLHRDPPYHKDRNHVFSIGDYIYSMENPISSSGKFYRYHVAQNTWTTVSIPPVSLHGANHVVVGEDVYFIVGSLNTESYRLFYKYNVTSDTWTNVGINPVREESNIGIAYTYGKIYVFCGLGVNDSWEYDIAKNTWTAISARVDIDYSTSCFAVGENIFILGSNQSNPVYKFNTTRKVVTSLQPMPNTMISRGKVLVQTDIYLSGGRTGPYTTSNKFDKFNTVRETWSVEPNLPIGLENHNLAYCKNKIYSLHGMGDSQKINTKMYVFSLAPKPYREGAFIISRNDEVTGVYATELVSSKSKISGPFSRTASGFNDAWLFHDGDIQHYPSYYGDGNKWVKFKN